MENDLSDEVLRAAAKGDAEAFAEIVRACQNTVYGMAFSSLKNREDALDISQEVFLKLYRSLPRFRFECAFSSFVYRITKNAVADFCRKRKIRPSDSLDALTEDGISFPDTRTEGDTFAAFAEGERKKLLYEAINTLPDIHREVILLYHFCGKSYEEIAVTLGIETGTVKSRMNRAKKELRNYLEKRNFF